MAKKNFDIYFEFNYLNLNLAAFNNFNNKLEFYKEQEYKTYFENYKKIDFNNLEELVEKNIFEIEKSTSELIKDVNLIIESPESISIKLSIMKNSGGKEIFKQDVIYLIQDAKQQILKSNSSLNILHIIIENYVLDKVDYKELPLNKICNHFSIDINFICFPKDLIKNFEKLFLKQQISIKRFICMNYVKRFFYSDIDKKICEHAKDIVDGANKQEVVLVPRIYKKKGFFEKLFYFFR